MHKSLHYFNRENLVDNRQVRYSIVKENDQWVARLYSSSSDPSNTAFATLKHEDHDVLSEDMNEFAQFLIDCGDAVS